MGQIDEGDKVEFRYFATKEAGFDYNQTNGTTQSWVSFGTTKKIDTKTGKTPQNLYIPQNHQSGLGFYSIKPNSYRTVKVIFGVPLRGMNGKFQPYS